MSRSFRFLVFTLALLAPAAASAQRASSRGYGVEPPPPATTAPRPAQPVTRVVYVVVPQVLYVNPDGSISVLAPYEMLADGTMLVTYASDYRRMMTRCAPPPSPAPAVAMTITAGSRGHVVTTVPARDANACYSMDSGGTPNVRIWR